MLLSGYCPYCHGRYTLAAGGCVNHCPAAEQLTAIVRAAAEADITEQDEIENPIRDFAAALNPPGGALADALPFSLTAERARVTTRPTQPALFPDTEK